MRIGTTISAIILSLLFASVLPAAQQGFTNNLGMKFVYIRPGSFVMGSLSGESGRGGDETQHRVSLTKGFYLQATEVTQGQWEQVMGSRPWSGKNYVRENANNPASYVSWNNCQAFIRKLNGMEGSSEYRLPTETEWEYACRAGSGKRFCFGNSDGQLGGYAWYDENTDSAGETYGHGVGTKKPNAWGLYDMHGNVWEWCQDWYGDYPSGSVIDPKGPSSGAYRVYRGGSWGSEAGGCRSADRNRNELSSRFVILGFRLAAAQSSRPLSESKIIKRDGTYVAYANGIVKDTKTGLEWVAGPDENTDWLKAKTWVQNLDLGGGWRMPTLDELEGLYIEGSRTRKMTLLMKTSGRWVWSVKTDKGSSDARSFHFISGARDSRNLDDSRNGRAFAVRSPSDE